MQYTDHYNLNLPEGTDIVNPLVQDNPNYTAIDNALYANKLRVIGTATELTTGTVHALTRADQDIPVFRFVATSDYIAGDTFTVDGVSVTARIANGETIPSGAYKINSSVLCMLDGTILNIVNVNAYTDANHCLMPDNTSVKSKIDSIETAIATNSIKTATVTGTTTPTGLFNQIAESYVSMISAFVEDGYNYIAELYKGTSYWAARVIDQNGNPVGSAAIRITFYYV